MSTCDVIDTEDWQGADVDTIGAGGFGVLGSEIAASGTNGPGYAYNDLTLPADAGKEICGRVTTWPVHGTLYAYEDTSFVYTRSGDGSDSFQYQLYSDGIAIGSPQTVSLAVGAVSAAAPGATLTGTASIIAGEAAGAAAGTAPGASLTGTAQIIAGTATGGTGAVDAAAPGAVLLGTASIQAGTATGQASATAPGCELTGLASIFAGTAEAITYARAPAGSGYAPQRDTRMQRPAAIQRNNR